MWKHWADINLGTKWFISVNRCGGGTDIGGQKGLPRPAIKLLGTMRTLLIACGHLPADCGGLGLLWTTEPTDQQPHIDNCITYISHYVVITGTKGSRWCTTKIWDEESGTFKCAQLKCQRVWEVVSSILHYGSGVRTDCDWSFFVYATTKKNNIPESGEITISLTPEHTQNNIKMTKWMDWGHLSVSKSGVITCVTKPPECESRPYVATSVGTCNPLGLFQLDLGPYFR